MTTTQEQQTQKKKMMSGYEQTREERIKHNLERMKKLGIFDLSLKLKSVKPVRRNSFTSKMNGCDRKTPRSPCPITSPEPIRRSSRLQNTTPVSYIELRPEKEEASSKRKHNLLIEGSKPEEYTDEHEKLLGSTEMSWDLFVDGTGPDGKRIYDSFKGKTCHQCRQKTLGHRTHCSRCGMVQGQFCGDCLYMRYGEHVLEANRNPEWICPVCRGICNCSLCRQAKGWAPTGPLYKKICRLGYKSVAHYLIQTHRSQTDSNEKSDTEVSVSAKKSLPFSDAEPIPEVDKDMELVNNENKEPSTPKNDNHQSKVPNYEEGKTDDELESETPCSEKNQGSSDTAPDKKMEELSRKEEEKKDSLGTGNEDSELDKKRDDNLEGKEEKIFSKETNNGSDTEIQCSEKTQDSSDNGLVKKTDDELVGKEDESICCTKSENGNENSAEKSSRSSKRKKKTSSSATFTDSIAERLRQRRRVGN